MVSEVRQKAGIENFHFHDLRHTFASRHAMAGTDLLTLARLLGHSKVTQTEKYFAISFARSGGRRADGGGSGSG